MANRNDDPAARAEQLKAELREARRQLDEASNAFTARSTDANFRKLEEAEERVSRLERLLVAVQRAVAAQRVADEAAQREADIARARGLVETLETELLPRRREIRERLAVGMLTCELLDRDDATTAAISQAAYDVLKLVGAHRVSVADAVDGVTSRWAVFAHLADLRIERILRDRIELRRPFAFDLKLQPIADACERDETALLNALRGAIERFAAPAEDGATVQQQSYGDFMAGIERARREHEHREHEDVARRWREQEAAARERSARRAEAANQPMEDGYPRESFGAAVHGGAR